MKDILKFFIKNNEAPIGLIAIGIKNNRKAYEDRSIEEKFWNSFKIFNPSNAFEDFRSTKFY